MASSNSKPDSNLFAACPKCKSKHKRGTKCAVDRVEDRESMSVYNHLTRLNKIQSREELRIYNAEAKKMAGSKTNKQEMDCCSQNWQTQGDMCCFNIWIEIMLPQDAT